MTIFPRRIALRVIPSQGLSFADGILVALRLYSGRRPYYGTLMGLTDAQGMVERSFLEIESDFRHDQTLFLMDFRVPLDQCDPRIDLEIQGGGDFIDHVQAIASNPLVTPEARAQYATARNQWVGSAQVNVQLTAPPQDLLLVELRVSPAS